MKMTLKTKLELHPGDKIVTIPYNRIYTVTRITENQNQLYVVFSNGVWRPLTTYGKTWKKLG